MILNELLTKLCQYGIDLCYIHYTIMSTYM